MWIDKDGGNAIWINPDMVMIIEAYKPTMVRGATYSRGSIITMAGGTQIYTKYPTTELVATLNLHQKES